jgi:hypothetical protein
MLLPFNSRFQAQACLTALFLSRHHPSCCPLLAILDDHRSFHAGRGKLLCKPQLAHVATCNTLNNNMADAKPDAPAPDKTKPSPPLSTPSLPLLPISTNRSAAPVHLPPALDPLSSVTPYDLSSHAGSTYQSVSMMR